MSKKVFVAFGVDVPGHSPETSPARNRMIVEAGHEVGARLPSRDPIARWMTPLEIAMAF